MGYKNGGVLFPAALLRHKEIRQKHEDGMSVKQLSETYYISPQRIYKILSDGK